MKIKTSAAGGHGGGHTHWFETSLIPASVIPSSGGSPAPTPPVVTVPSAPLNVVAVAGNASVSLSWETPTNTGGAAVTSYIIVSYLSGSPLTPIVTGTAALTATVSSLTNNDSYTFTVAATNSAGTGSASATSNAVAPTSGSTGVITRASGFPVSNLATPPLTTLTINPQNIGDLVIVVAAVAAEISVTQVTNVTCPKTTAFQALTPAQDNTYGYDAVTIYWATAISTGSTTVTVAYSGTTSGVYSFLYADSLTTGLGTAWTWSLVAQGSVVTASSATPLNAALTSGVVSSTNVEAYWGYWFTENTGVDGTTSGFTYSLPIVGVIGVNLALAATTAYTPNGKQSSAGWATAVGAIFVAAPTPPPSATVPSVMNAPTCVPGSAEVTVSFEAPASNGGSVLTSYIVTSYLGGAYNPNGTQIFTPQTPINTGSTALSYSVTGLVNNSNYVFTVAAVNAVGAGPASLQSQPTTPVGTGTSVPGTPTGVEATAGNSEVVLAWTAPASNGSAITGYTVVPYIGGAAQTPISTGSTSATYTVTGLNPGTTYTFAVSATNAIGTGNLSAQSAAATPTSSGAPIPTVNGSNPYAAWTAVTNAMFDFQTMSTASGPPTGWNQGYINQGGSSNGYATNSSIVGGTGLELNQPSSSSGVCLVTDPNYVSPGLTIAMPFFREVKFNAPVNGTPNNVNHVGSWCLSAGPTYYEVDMIETLDAFGAGSCTCTLHAGPSSNYQASTTHNFGVLSGWHIVGAHITTGGVDLYLDGTLAVTLSWPTYTPPAGQLLYLLHQTDDTPSYGGVSDTPATYEVAYDYSWQP